MSRIFSTTLSEQPAASTESRLSAIRKLSKQLDKSVVVLDDDPTGTQTVYDVPVLTEWSVDSLRSEFEQRTPLFFVLTNSRSLTSVQAERLATEIGENLVQAAQQAGREFEVISRSDSTLRGHFPGEVRAIAQAIGTPAAPQILIPFFEEGGRVTVDDIHYVVSDDQMLPAADTPFAKDSVFGFRHSNLREWVEEKTDQGMSADDVVSISIGEIRSDLAAVEHKLASLDPNSVVVVNCLEFADLECFTQAALRSMAAGRQFLFRTAASYVRARSGLECRALLEVEELVGGHSKAGGLIVVGSYVVKTTNQLKDLRDSFPRLRCIELAVDQLIDDQQRDASTSQASEQVNQAIEAGRDVVLYTSRTLVLGNDATQNLEIGQLVSAALVKIVSSISTQPRFLIAKGGITSSDIATQALRVRRATVLGQVIPGVPVWSLSESSRYPGMSLVIFPGNVGDDRALSHAYSVVANSTNHLDS